MSFTLTELNSDGRVSLRSLLIQSVNTYIHFSTSHFVLIVGLSFGPCEYTVTVFIAVMINTTIRKCNGWEKRRVNPLPTKSYLMKQFSLFCIIYFDNFYRPQTKFAKIMFSQVSVCPRGRGVHGTGSMYGRGHAWQVGCVWQRVCMAGGVHGRGCAWGACMAGEECVAGWGHAWRGHAWQGDVYGRVGGGGMHGRGVCGGEGVQERQLLQWAVRILLECIRVVLYISLASLLKTWIMWFI